jgi:hypothetical protein
MVLTSPIEAHAVHIDIALTKILYFSLLTGFWAVGGQKCKECENGDHHRVNIQTRPSKAWWGGCQPSSVCIRNKSFAAGNHHQYMLFCRQ